MSWDNWAEQLSLESCVCGGIIAADGGSIWGKVGNFSLTTYETSIDDGEGGTKKIKVNEG